jgi:1,4-alpha-glucan branching enzyme
MGNEFGHPEWVDFPRSGNNWSYHYARRQWSLRNDENLRYKFLADFDADMISLVTKKSDFFSQKANFISENIQDQVLIYERSEYIFIFSFNPTTSFPDYGFATKKGKYKVMLTIDSAKYGGLQRIDEQMIYTTTSASDKKFSEHFLRIYIPTQTAIVLKRV